MSHQQRVIPDPFEFALRGAKLDDVVDARTLSGVAGSLRDIGAAQHVHYELSGVRLDGKDFLSIAVSASLTMQCQRCLGDVRCEVEANSRLLLVPQTEELPDENLEQDDFDPVHAWRDFDVLRAVEEELLLALPLAPTHQQCSVPTAKENGEDDSPFAVLRGLKTSGPRES